jgi:hypothetical protein
VTLPGISDVRHAWLTLLATVALSLLAAPLVGEAQPPPRRSAGSAS